MFYGPLTPLWGGGALPKSFQTLDWTLQITNLAVWPVLTVWVGLQRQLRVAWVGLLDNPTLITSGHQESHLLHQTMAHLGTHGRLSNSLMISNELMTNEEQGTRSLQSWSSCCLTCTTLLQAQSKMNFRLQPACVTSERQIAKPLHYQRQIIIIIIIIIIIFHTYIAQITYAYHQMRIT